MAEPGEPSQPDPGEVTRLLGAVQRGDGEARERLLPLVYGELRRLAGRQIRGPAGGQTLEATDLVHEACLKLLDRESPWESRSHFFCVAAKAMRSILVDHARARKAEKRGGGRERTPLHEAVAAFEERALDLVALDQILTGLAAFDERKSRLVELRFFGGLKMEEIARILGVSLATAEREWTVARAWLRARLGGGDI